MAVIAPTADSRIRRLPAASDPDLLALHRSNPARYPFLLESNAVPGIPATGRYDILFAFPAEHLCLREGGLEGDAHVPAADDDFLAALDAWFEREAGRNDTGLPFAGGWFLYLGYELAGQVEPRLELAGNGDGLPDALAVRCPAAVVRDRLSNATWLVSEPGDGDRLDAMAADLRAVAPANGSGTVAVAGIAEDPPQRYLDAVAATRDYIRAGDVFQVNLARTWRAELSDDHSPADLYAALRRTNPAPFAGLMQWKGAAVISSSPERLLRIDRGIAETRPIAGTRPRRPGTDEAMTRELLAHPKERAEHVMLIDLERNDLGRVSVYGSVAVNELMTLESYAHVHHIVSNVRGRLRPDVGPGGVLRAVFPGGTITGCPKVRCMEVISELEPTGRGAYTGAFGYLGRDGRLDSNILIRTLVQRDRTVSLRAGAGIVADSDPEQELAETRAKARGLLLSLGVEAA